MKYEARYAGPQLAVTYDLSAEKYLVPRLYYFHSPGVGLGQDRVR